MSSSDQALRADRSTRLAKTQAFAFCLIGIVLMFVINGALISGLRRLHNGDFGVWNALVAGDINADVLVIGASRALVDVDCEVVTKRLAQSCFDIGLDGSAYNLQQPLLETYLAHNRPPRIAIVSADIASLSNAREAYHPQQYLPYLDQPQVYERLKSLDPTLWWKQRYLPLYGFAHHGLSLTISAVQGLIKSPDSAAPTRVRGHLAVDLSWDGSFDNFMREVGDRGKIFPVEPAAIAHVAAMIRELRAGGAQVAIFYSPEWREMHRFELNRSEVLSSYRTVATSNGAVFLDYSDSPLSFDRSYFYNSQHMNRRGAILFSQVLSSDLAVLATRGAPTP
jgi:hypothetical protein